MSFKRKILTLSVLGSVNQSCAAQVLSLFFSFPLSDSNTDFWSVLVSLCLKASQLSGDEALHFSYTSHSSIKRFSGTFVSRAFLEMGK